MPNISNATVASGTGLSTAGNGGRKLVRLSNGWLVSTAHNLSATRHVLYVSKDEGATWYQLCFVTMASFTVGNASLVAKGTDVYLLTSTNSNVYCQRFDTLTVTNAEQYNASNFGISLEQSMGGTSLAINDAGTELHAAWSSKNSTYPNSFNIRYAKGTINPDGSVTWGAVEQVTNVSTAGYDFISPSISIDKNGISCIFAETIGLIANSNGSVTVSTAARSITVIKQSQELTRDTSRLGFGWTFRSVDGNNSSYAQSNPSATSVPTAINGLANGRLWVTWQANSFGSSTIFNIYTAYSDDGGLTWLGHTRQTPGNTYNQTNPSLTADKTGKVSLVWDAQNATTTQTAQKVFNGAWGETTTLTGDGYTNVSTLFDNNFSILMTSPPLVRQSSSGVFFSGNFNVGASVSPVSGALGNKETATLTAYTVTPEAGSTVTQIVERINGTVINTFNNPASLSRTLTVPNVTYDTLSYFATNTASVTVTDSNGATTVTTYSFDKTLATNASLLEATKANTDAKNRISDKRDALAAQVGLSAGSTFDAILGQFTSGSIVKKQTGTSTATSVGVFSVTGLAFRPKLLLYWVTNTPETMSIFQTYNPTPVNYPQIINLATASTTGLRPVSEVTVTDSSITGLRFAANANITWIAFS